MNRPAWIVLFGLIAQASAVRAQDAVFTKTSKDKAAVTGFVKQESPRGVKLEGVKQEIPAEDIRDIVYHVEPTSLRLKYYNPAVQAEKDAVASTDDKKRAKHLADALQNYEDTLVQLKEDYPFAKRHLEFKVATLRVWLAQEAGDAKMLNQAVNRLRDFKSKHPQAWQLGACLKELGQLLVARGDYDEAERTYRELAQAKFADATRQDAELSAVQVAMQAGRMLLKQGKQIEAGKKFAEAEKNLSALSAALPKGSRQQVRVTLAHAECLAAAKKLPQAQKLCKDVLTTTKKEDKSLKAMAYNTLGYCYYLNEQWQEARWQFLWVDAVYNQDKGEHAKALYYLGDVFARLGEPERAQEFLDALRNDRQFAGSEYQRQALREVKTP